MKQGNRNIISDLIESTVKVIARDGFDKASVRNICRECDLPNSYIYVHFKDKYDLYAGAFRLYDIALAEEVGKHLFILDQTGLTNENRMYYLYYSIWIYLLADPDSCRFYIQYYYSPHYQKYSAQDHFALWEPVVEQMKVMFRPGTDVRAVLSTAVNTMLDHVVKAAADTSANTDLIAQSNFELVLGMVRTCLI